jgi:dihydropyrimidinase
MHVLWHHGVKTGRITANEFVAVTSANAAKIFNLYPRKGSVSAGADADLVVWDPVRERRISKETHHQKIDINLFEGMTVRGVNVVTVSRGEVLYRDGDLRTVPGAGRYIAREPFPPYFETFQRQREHAQARAVDRASAQT